MGTYRDRSIILGRRKTNIKKKIQNRRNKSIMMRQKYEIDKMVEDCFGNLIDILIDDMNKHEAYRWN